MMSCVWVDCCRSHTRCHLLLPASSLYRQRSRTRRARRGQPDPESFFSPGFANARWSEPVLDSNADEVNIARAGSGVSNFVNRSEEHTSELQSHHDLVCRLLLEKKK